MTAPFMPLYVGDYLRDTVGLSCEQSGAYLHLLMAMWAADGRLPADDRKLARMVRCTPSRWAKIKDDVLAFFEVDGEWISHRRLSLELEKAREKSIKRADAGTRGGVAKALKDKEAKLANASVLPCHSSEPEPEERSSSLRSEEPRAAARSQPADDEPELEIIPPDSPNRPITPADFERVFWPTYPHKVGKIAAEKAWAKACKRKGLTLDAVKLGLERYQRTKPPDRPWCNPATWLNEGRWDDVEQQQGNHHRNGAGVAERRPNQTSHGALLSGFARVAAELRRSDDISGDAEEWGDPERGGPVLALEARRRA